MPEIKLFYFSSINEVKDVINVLKQGVTLDVFTHHNLNSFIKKLEDDGFPDTSTYTTTHLYAYNAEDFNFKQTLLMLTSMHTAIKGEHSKKDVYRAVAPLLNLIDRLEESFLIINKWPVGISTTN